MSTPPLPPLQKILIVDDSPTNIRALHAILSTEHEVLFATSGEEGLELALRERPDLILLDVVMPGLDGYGVLRSIKRDLSIAGIPVIFVTAKGDVADETLGLQLGAIDYIVKPFSPGIVRVRVNNHLELKRHRDLLRELSNRDGLTGIANRHSFDETLQREWSRAARAHSPLSLLLVDIDHFKAFNELCGHATGDDCLRRVARTVAAVPMRPADLTARYGGEEFACILPDTPQEGAVLLGQRMLERVHALDIANDAAPSGRLSISLGVATTLPTPGCEPGPLLRRAETALSRAKTNGRNRLLVDDTPQPRPSSLLQPLPATAP